MLYREDFGVAIVTVETFFPWLLTSLKPNFTDIFVLRLICNGGIYPSLIRGLVETVWCTKSEDRNLVTISLKFMQQIFHWRIKFAMHI
jgi:hypothetical protein